MTIGNHGAQHLWLNKVSKTEQKNDTIKGIEFLEYLGQKSNDWIMAYPYGEFNKTTIKLIKDLGAICAFKADRINFNKSNIKLFELPRFDTNEFPK